MEDHCEGHKVLLDNQGLLQECKENFASFQILQDVPIKIHRQEEVHTLPSHKGCLHQDKG